VPVRVLDCNGSGTWSGVIAGVDWVTKNAVKPAVANMSLGGGASSSVDDAVRTSIAAGVTYAVSAGNDSGGDACTKSPARVAEALTVASTDKTDTRSSFSNIGTCVDLFAPGSSITSAYSSSDTATATMSGTSMAAPHVAGVAALHLAVNSSASAAAVGDAVVGNATKDLVQSAGSGSPNLLLHSRWSTVVVEEPAAATGTLTGTITSSVGGALSGSTVSAGGLTTTTDTSGTYTLVLAGGSHTVTASAPGHDTSSAPATVTNGATTTVNLALTKQVTPTGIGLSAKAYKVQGSQRVDLTWSGATSTNVDIFRGSTKVATTANDGAHIDSINKKGGGTYTYKVCEAGTATCSASVTVTF
jgi:subtilisin family serine protease